MTAYYNENDPYVAEWLRNLIEAGHIAKGDVDERSIADVTPNDIKQYTQCHFFAGIGVWSLALRLAGWPDNRPVWTGSCPCQPFSTAGKGVGFDDQRHLWPHWNHLISECKPSDIFGEQVASKDGLGWLDLIQADLENAGYASAAVDTCAAGYGTPNIRQRLYFTAQRLANTESQRCAELEQQSGNVCETRFAGQGDNPRTGDGSTDTLTPGSTNNLWSDVDWLFCTDGKWRAVRPGTFPLAHGITARVGRLCAYGNAINAYQAKAFIEAGM